ncbi:MAG: hypothetical protein HOQ29_08635 [Acidobacteria bacterium]|nr:hypothetical protein [Acidobacteriota bacterium]
MSPSDVCIAAIAFARDDQEDALIRRALQRLSAIGFPIVVADGGSSPALVDALARLPRVTLVKPPTRGLVPQVKAALATAAALDTPFVLYTESDKAEFFERHLAAFLSRAPSDNDVGVSVAARSEASFATFPPLQRYCEHAIAHLTAEVTHVAGDYSYGPFLMHRALLDEMRDVPDDLGWGWRHFMFAAAALRGRRVAHVVGDYDCPIDQRHEGEHERMHRLRQLSQSVEGLVLALQRLRAGGSSA